MSITRELADGGRIPALGLGTWGIGGRSQPDDTRDEESVTALRMALDLGFTHVDTAEYYGGGHCEELVGRAIEGRDRGKLFLSTKVWRSHHSRKDLKQALAGSLRRLGVEYVDLYMIHQPNSDVPLRETMRALEECCAEGFTRYIGVSNFSATLMEQAQEQLREGWIAVNQAEYSLVDQKPRMELLPACRRLGVLLMAYRPLAHGILAQPGHQVLDDLASKYGKTRAQVALNWLLSQEGVAAIPKSTNPVHLLEAVSSGEWRLSPDDWERLSESFV